MPGCCAEAFWAGLSFAPEDAGVQKRKTISIFKEESAAVVGSETDPGCVLGDSVSMLLVLRTLNFDYLLRIPWES